MKRRSFMKLAGGVALFASCLLSLPSRLIAKIAAAIGASGPATQKVLCLGLDGMDPGLLERYLAEGRLPNFARLVASGDFRTCGTTIPPQSPVAWSSFITGLDPGGHGIFDFIHRSPETMLPHLSMAETHPPSRFLELGKWRFPRTGGSVHLRRKGTAFWEYLADAGVDVTIFKMPANFPPVDCAVRSISGMGTPDILGTYGLFSYFTDRPPAVMDIGGGRIIPVRWRNQGFEASICGPPNPYRDGNPDAEVSFTVKVDAENPAGLFHVGDESFVLQEGEWSDWLTLHFPLVSHWKEVTGICRFYLMEVRPTFRLYVTPVQIDPADPAMPISTPSDYASELAAATGSFYTQGLPDDTKALDEGIFQDIDYIRQSDLVLAERRRQYHHELDRFRNLDRGFLFFYFNSLDQNCHMFWRDIDPHSPQHADAAASRADRIGELYAAMDEVLGEAMMGLDDRTVLFVVSDHGFAPYRRSFNLNTWLLENGYLYLRNGFRRRDVMYLDGVDWRRTTAYGLGINGLYLNLKGRERRGFVERGGQRDRLLAELVTKLEAAVDPETGDLPIKHAYRTDLVYSGPQVDDAPDIVLGCGRGYRVSNASALGEIPGDCCVDNLLKWSGDHCIAADEVPGVLLCNRKLRVEDPSLLDMAPTFLHLFGLRSGRDMRGRSLLG